MAADKLRVGVIGTGFGTVVQIPAFQLCDETEVVAVCSARLERAEAAAERFGVANAFADYREMLGMTGLDAVSIVTPPFLHREMALAALSAGKHVLCEKPLALDESQASEMAAEARRSGLTAMVAHEFRFASQRSFAAWLIQDGYLGEVRHVDISVNVLYGGPPPRPWGWLAERAKGGGLLGALGSHYVDMLRSWLGEIVEVRGYTRTVDPVREVRDSGERRLSETDDTFGFTARLASGPWATMAACTALIVGAGAHVAAYGSEGTIVLPQGHSFNPLPRGIVLGARFGESELKELPMPERFLPLVAQGDDRLTPFVQLVRAFARGVRDGRSPSPNFQDGLRCQQVLDAVRRSDDESGWVTVPT